MQSDLADIKQGLNSRIEELCRKLLPNGQREGKQWVSHNPRVAGDEKKLPALKVGLVHERGAWIDWRSGDKGDVLKLVAHVIGTDTSGALKWGRDFLGLKTMTREERQAMRDLAKVREKLDAEKADRARALKLVSAQRLFDMGEAIATMGIAEAHARAYLAGRACGLEPVQYLNPFSLRFSAATEWWRGAKWEQRNGRNIKCAKGPLFPAMHAGMRQANGIVTCCHVTYLDPARPKKAPVQPAKLMYGIAMGAVIELSMGPGGKPFWHERERLDPVIICEGIETGLSIAAAAPDARVWAAGSLIGMGTAPVTLPCVANITIARDNNTGNAQAEAALDRALNKLAESGRPLVVMRSHVGDDFNDLARGVSER